MDLNSQKEIYVCMYVSLLSCINVRILRNKFRFVSKQLQRVDL